VSLPIPQRGEGVGRAPAGPAPGERLHRWIPLSDRRGRRRHL